MRRLAAAAHRSRRRGERLFGGRPSRRLPRRHRLERPWPAGGFRRRRARRERHLRSAPAAADRGQWHARARRAAGPGGQPGDLAGAGRTALRHLCRGRGEPRVPPPERNAGCRVDRRRRADEPCRARRRQPFHHGRTVDGSGKRRHRQPRRALPPAMTAAPPLKIETPSGKGSGDENFPVGSFLLPRRLRPHVATYYAFARAIDDIADNPQATPAEKLARLDAMERALDGLPGEDAAAVEKATRLRSSLIATRVDFAHARDLVSAFRQDAVKGRYADWDELMDYCNRSASPVGRYLLELHGEDPAGFRQSDALCNALQVINHLQDCAADYRSLDRVYLPGDWLAAEGADVAMLAAAASTPPLRRVIRRTVARCRQLMPEARALPSVLKSRHLAMESAVIVRVADRLLDELAQRDPVAERVELTKVQFALCGISGAIAGMLR